MTSRQRSGTICIHYLSSALTPSHYKLCIAVCVCVCLTVLLLTLHGLDEALDSVGSDAESSTLLHEDRRDVAVHVQIVYRLWLQTQRVHELPAGGEETSQHITAKINSLLSTSTVSVLWYGMTMNGVKSLKIMDSGSKTIHGIIIIIKHAITYPITQCNAL